MAKIPEIRGKAAAGLKDFYKLMTGLRAKLELPPHDLIKMVLEESGYKESLQEASRKKTMTSISWRTSKKW